MSFFVSFLLFPFLCSLRGFTDDDDERGTDDDEPGGNVSEAGSDE